MYQKNTTRNEMVIIYFLFTEVMLFLGCLGVITILAGNLSMTFDPWVNRRCAFATKKGPNM